MREKLIELLMQCTKECAETGCEQCIYYDCSHCGSEHIADFLIKNGVTITRAEDLKRTASRNYEAEYNELHHKYNSL